MSDKEEDVRKVIHQLTGVFIWSNDQKIDYESFYEGLARYYFFNSMRVKAATAAKHLTERLQLFALLDSAALGTSYLELMSPDEEMTKDEQLADYDYLKFVNHETELAIGMMNKSIIDLAGRPIKEVLTEIGENEPLEFGMTDDEEEIASMMSGPEMATPSNELAQQFKSIQQSLGNDDNRNLAYGYVLSQAYYSWLITSAALSLADKDKDIWTITLALTKRAIREIYPLLRKDLRNNPEVAHALGTLPLARKEAANMVNIFGTRISRQIEERSEEQPQQAVQQIAPAAKRFCNNCGATMQATAMFCNKCGAKRLV